MSDCPFVIRGFCMRSRKALESSSQDSWEIPPFTVNSQAGTCAERVSIIGSAIPDDGGTQLMLQAKNGDAAAFEALAEKVRRPLFGFLFRMVHDQAVAEELAQETFLRVYRSRHTYAAKAKFSTYLYRIAANLAINHARDNRQERAKVTASLDERDERSDSTLDAPDPSLSAEQAILRRERLAAIRRHVDALPERQRVAVLMHKYQGLDYRQIGEALDLGESATKSLLFRAYETLREKLKEFL